MKGLASVLAIIITAIAAAACKNGAQTPGTATQPNPAPTQSPDSLLQLVEAALSNTTGYTIDVTGHNFVLPRWGGIDTGTIEIATTGATASARLDRTGDGLYEMALIDGRTYFKRTTCPHMTRVPGDGGDVFTPFLIAGNGYLANASALSFTHSEDPRRVVITGMFSDFGVGTIEIDTATSLPTTMSKSTDPSSGSQTTWHFTNWGATPHVTAPTGDIAENGPGGNPC